MMHLMIALTSLIALSATLTLIGMMLLHNADKIVAALQLDDAHLPLSGDTFGKLGRAQRAQGTARYRVVSGALPAPAAL